MLKPYIQQLKSQDPATRRKAIKALARLRNPAAVPLLETVANSDPDPELRTLAEKAIRYINANAISEPTAAPAPETPGDAPTAEEAAPRTPRRYIPPRDRENARAYVNAAFNYAQAGDPARAVEWLGKALSVNPHLQQDSFVAGIVQSVMHMSVAEALPILTHVDRRKEYIAMLGGKKRIGASNIPPDATWDNVLIDFGLYGVVVMAGHIASRYFMADMLSEMFHEMARNSPQYYDTSGIDAFLNMNLRETLGLALLGAIYALIGAVFQGGFIHLAATKFVGGNGALVYLFRKLIPFQTVLVLLTTSTAIAVALLGGFAAMPLLSLFNTAFGLVALYWITRIVAEVYDFGMGSGCVAILAGGLIGMAIFFCGGLALLSVLSSLLGAG